MVIRVVLTAIYFILAGLAIIQGTWMNASKIDRPLMYNSVFIEGILNLGLILYLIMTVALFFIYGWKYGLAIFGVSIVLGKPIFYRLSKTIVILPIVKAALAKEEEEKGRT